MNPTITEVPLRTRALEAAQRARASGFPHFSDALVALAHRSPPCSFDHGVEPVSTIQPHDNESPT
jgi:hypothetical protein